MDIESSLVRRERAGVKVLPPPETYPENATTSLPYEECKNPIIDKTTKTAAKIHTRRATMAAFRCFVTSARNQTGRIANRKTPRPNPIDRGMRCSIVGKPIARPTANRATAATMSAGQTLASTALSSFKGISPVRIRAVQQLRTTWEGRSILSMADWAGAKCPHMLGRWCRLRDLNSRPTAYKAVALPLS